MLIYTVPTVATHGSQGKVFRSNILTVGTVMAE